MRPRWTRLHEQYPNDSEASIFYALALLEAVDLTDEDVYESAQGCARSSNGSRRIQPEHPGIVHYLIHSYDYAPIAARGLPAARRYATLATSAPHALHMPSHIFSTLGMWREAIESNLAADAANLAYAKSVNPRRRGEPRRGLQRAIMPLDFLTNAYMQLAQDGRARAIVDQRNSIPVFPPGERITNHTAYAAIPGPLRDRARRVERGRDNSRR